MAESPHSQLGLELTFSSLRKLRFRIFAALKFLSVLSSSWVTYCISARARIVAS
jgi:hypothetical protein